jgi:hypothetical protein
MALRRGGWAIALFLSVWFPPVLLRAEEKPADTAPACEACSGLRIVPVQPFQPFVMVADGKPYETIAPWKPCPKCSAGVAEKAATDELSACLEKAIEVKATWSERTGVELKLVATPYLALYTQARPQEIRDYALMAEKLAGHLQTLTGSMTLTRTRAGQDGIILLNENKACRRLIEEMAKLHPGEGWENCKDNSGGVDQHIAFSNLTRSGATADHHVVYLFGQILMYEATDNKAPPWLREGFAAYSERTLFNQNLYASFSYKENQPKLEPHWPRAMRTAFQKGERVSLGGVLSLDMASASSTDYLCCFSVVSYLLEAHPKEFVRFVLLLRAGEMPRKALETAYGKSLDDLNAEWRKWALNLGKL